MSSYEIGEMRNVKASVMLEKMVLNASVGSTGVLIKSGTVVFLAIATSMVIGYLSQGFETVYLTSKVGDHLVGAYLSSVGAGKRLLVVLDVVFFLEIMAS